MHQSCWRECTSLSANCLRKGPKQRGEPSFFLGLSASIAPKSPWKQVHKRGATLLTGSWDVHSTPKVEAPTVEVNFRSICRSGSKQFAAPQKTATVCALFSPLWPRYCPSWSCRSCRQPQISRCLAPHSLHFSLISAAVQPRNSLKSS